MLFRSGPGLRPCCAPRNGPGAHPPGPWGNGRVPADVAGPVARPAGGMGWCARCLLNGRHGTRFEGAVWPGAKGGAIAFAQGNCPTVPFRDRCSVLERNAWRQRFTPPHPFRTKTQTNQPLSAQATLAQQACKGWHGSCIGAVICRRNTRSRCPKH